METVLNIAAGLGGEKTKALIYGGFGLVLLGAAARAGAGDNVTAITLFIGVLTAIYCVEKNA